MDRLCHCVTCRILRGARALAPSESDLRELRRRRQRAGAVLQQAARETAAAGGFFFGLILCSAKCFAREAVRAAFTKPPPETKPASGETGAARENPQHDA